MRALQPERLGGGIGRPFLPRVSAVPADAAQVLIRAVEPLHGNVDAAAFDALGGHAAERRQINIHFWRLSSTRSATTADAEGVGRATDRDRQAT